jgi:exonuclease III
MPNEVKIVCANVNGFRSRKSEIRDLLEKLGNDCVLVMNNTRLNGGVSKGDIPGFSIFRKDNSSASKGLAIKVPSSWCFEPVVDFRSTTHSCEALAGAVIPRGADPIKISTCYYHPGWESLPS